LAQYTAPRKSGTDLGPGFWQVGIGLTIFNLIATYFIATWDINKVLPEAGAPAGDIDALFKYLTVLGSAIFVYVAGFIVYFAIVWRRRPSDGPDAIGVQIHDAPKLELWWTIIPSILVITIAVFSVKIWANLQNTAGDVLTMEAIGHQFKFEFRYPGMKNSVYDDMHVPAGTPVTLNITSADVLHSYWVPELRVKADMVPGLIQTLRFTPTTVGKYRVICTEFCGTQHANMAGNIFVDTQQDFEKWRGEQLKAAGQSAGPINVASGQVAAGQALFGQKCSTCHSVGPFTQKIVGPGLGHLASDPAYPKLVTGDAPDGAGISHILVNGYQGPDNSQGKNAPSIGVMPNRQANALSNQDIANLTVYLLSLSKKS
jgi:cytochrome c oxidase subunit 2